MIINQDSILKRLPFQLNKKQFLIFDAIRFSGEIVDTCWFNLINLIEIMSEEDADYKKDHPRLFNYAWSIIDTTKKIIGLHSRLTIESQKEIMKPIHYVKEFRNTYQHLDERIEEAFIESKTPVYGIISWSYHNHITKKTEGFITSTGIERFENEFHFKFPEYDESATVENIMMDTIVRKGKDTFERAQIDFTALILELEKIIQFIEDDLQEKISNSNIQTIDWTKRRDILLRLKSSN